MLSELKDILDRLQTGNLPDNAKQQRASRMMKDLNDVISKQQKLLDDTFKTKREQGERGSKQSQQFDVSPPGQPHGIRSRHVAWRRFGHAAEDGQTNGQKQRGQRELARENRPQASRRGGKQQQGTARRPVRRSRASARQELRDKLQSLIDRFRIEGAECLRPIRWRRQIDGQSPGRDRRGQSRPGH